MYRIIQIKSDSQYIFQKIGTEKEAIEKIEVIKALTHLVRDC